MKTARKCLSIGLWVVIVGLLANIGHIFLSRHGVHAQIRAPFAYTAILRETDRDATRGPRTTVAVTWAVKSDGSRAARIEATTPARHAERIIDFASGKRVTLDDLHGMKSTTMYSDAMDNSWIRDPESECLKFNNGQTMPNQIVAGHETISGYQTVKITRDNMAWWYAPDHGCAMIKLTADWGDSKSEQDLVSLTAGEPSASLFAVPARFQEGSPSKLACVSESAALQGEPCRIPSAIAQKMDEGYYAHLAQE